MKWINVAGLVFQFFAFWFAAPELLGTETLKRFEKSLIRFLSFMPSLWLGLAGVLVGISMGMYGISKGMSASQNNSDITFTLVTIISVSVLYMVYMIFFYKKLQTWIESVFARPVILKLITHNESRKSALVIGAILFTLGFICQLTALLFS